MPRHFSLVSQVVNKKSYLLFLIIKSTNYQLFVYLYFFVRVFLQNGQRDRLECYYLLKSYNNPIKLIVIDLGIFTNAMMGFLSYNHTVCQTAVSHTCALLLQWRFGTLLSRLI